MPPKTIDEYLAGLPAEKQAALANLRATVRQLVPEAVELVSYGMASFKYRKKPLISFAAWENHCSVYGMDQGVLSEAERREFKTSKGTLKFTPDQPLPGALIGRLLRARVAAIDAKLDGL